MAEEENKDMTEEAPAEATETAAPEVAAQETPAEEPVAEEIPAPAEEPVAEEAPAPAAPAEEKAAPEPVRHPKEIRRTSRSAHSGAAQPARTPEERHAARKETRKAKAKARSAYRVKARAKAKERRAAHPVEETAAVHAEATGHQKLRQGVVVSDKADKTITVRIDIVRRHRRYQKVMRSSSTLHAHDERNDAHEGDTVKVVEARPLSRSKRWRLVEVVERAK